MVHRYPLAELKCVSPKRRKEMAARLGGAGRRAAARMAPPGPLPLAISIWCVR
jgi:hypothetical protein